MWQPAPRRPPTWKVSPIQPVQTALGIHDQLQLVARRPDLPPDVRRRLPLLRDPRDLQQVHGDRAPLQAGALQERLQVLHAHLATGASYLALPARESSDLKHRRHFRNAGPAAWDPRLTSAGARAIAARRGRSGSRRGGSGPGRSGALGTDGGGRGGCERGVRQARDYGRGITRGRCAGTYSESGGLHGRVGDAMAMSVYRKRCG